MKVFISGRRGRMGKAIVTIVDESTTMTIADALDQADVVIDFSAPEALQSLLQQCKVLKIPMVCGTTGFTTEQRTELTHAATEIPIVYASNMSVGICVARHLVREATRMLGEGFDVEIVEAHHRRKKDSPSGTALSLAEEVADIRQQDLDGVAVHRSAGVIGERSGDEIGFSVIRGGSIVGDHRVLFCGDDERIEISHQAGNRSIFAAGALRAARFLVEGHANTPLKLMTMDDVLGK